MTTQAIQQSITELDLEIARINQDVFNAHSHIPGSSTDIGAAQIHAAYEMFSKVGKHGTGEAICEYHLTLLSVSYAKL